MVDDGVEGGVEVVQEVNYLGVVSEVSLKTIIHLPIYVHIQQTIQNFNEMVLFIQRN